MEETVLREQLRTVDESLLFLLLIVLSVLLSYWGVRIQREGLCRTLQGDAEGAAALPRSPSQCTPYCHTDLPPAQDVRLVWTPCPGLTEV